MKCELTEAVGSKNILTKVRERVEECFLKAEQFYGEKIPRAKISFDLTGVKGGTSCYAKKLLRFNRKLVVENEKEYFEIVIPHEVAHHVTRWKHGYAGVRSHGNEWKHSMVKIFGIPPKRTHCMDVSSVKKKTKNYRYTCSCPSKNTYMVGAVKHRRMQANPRALCARCVSPFVWEGKGEVAKPKRLIETEL